MTERSIKSLLVQLKITEFEVERRKQLLGLSASEADLLATCKNQITDRIDSIVADFYAKQTANDEIALLIGDADTLSRLHSAQRGYILDLFDGYYGLEYVNNRLRIGMVHKRIGVEPKLYLSAVKTLKDIIEIELDSFLADKKILKQVLNALDKLLYFDTTLIFDTYIHALLSEVESAKNKVQSYAQELETKVAERTQQLQDLSQHDPLTGLLNRRALNDDLRRQLAMAKRQNKSFTLVYLDVDDFKQINDSRGHFGGDEVLKQVATALKSVCREVDVPCRYGGDEFCMILPDSNLDEAKIACQRLEDYFAINMKGITLSIGIAMSGPSEHVTPDELLRAADKKMYEAKAQDGFSICI